MSRSPLFGNARVIALAMRECCSCRRPTRVEVIDHEGVLGIAVGVSVTLMGMIGRKIIVTVRHRV
ncbi:hypothetical protein, partial [Enterobacter hormaechei]|uniref:hypothetical protein n=1 Tax=Enterobacter hormaechei TaxID=158836 RepID=UPI0013D8DA2E